MLALSEPAMSAGFALEHVATIGSTSQTLLERAARGETGPLWLVSDEQVTGRGRRQRDWTSPRGNLYASLLLTDPGPAAKLAQLSFVFALALRDAVLAITQTGPTPPDVTLKWPNDLMVKGRKCAGVLLEGGSHAGRHYLVLGMGVNIVSHPEGTNHPATDLTEAGLPAERDALFGALSSGVVHRLAQWNRGDGFTDIREAWLGCAFNMGRELTVNLPNERFTAKAVSLDRDGALVVIRDGAEQIISSGEVFALDEQLEVRS